MRLDEKAESVERIECSQNSRRQHDAAQAQDSDDDEPPQHDGAADPPDEAGPSALNKEQSDQNCERDRRTTGANPGASTFRPSTALSTEIAGVMAPSP